MINCIFGHVCLVWILNVQETRHVLQHVFIIFTLENLATNPLRWQMLHCFLEITTERTCLNPAIVKSVVIQTSEVQLLSPVLPSNLPVICACLMSACHKSKWSLHVTVVNSNWCSDKAPITWNSLNPTEAMMCKYNSPSFTMYTCNCTWLPKQTYELCYVSIRKYKINVIIQHFDPVQTRIALRCTLSSVRKLL